MPFSEAGTFQDQLESYALGDMQPNETLLVAQSCHQAGLTEVSDMPLMMKQRTLRKIAYDHEISLGQLRDLPNWIRDHPLALDSLTDEGSIVVVADARDKDGLPIVIAVRIEREYEAMVVDEVTSVYGKRNLAYLVENTVNAGLGVYANDRTERWLSSMRLPLPQSIATHLAGIIRDHDPEINARQEASAEVLAWSPHQEVPDAVSLQALVDVCEGHVNKAFREAGVVTSNEHDFIGELERQSRPRQNPSLDCLLRDMYIDAVVDDDPTLQEWLDTELGKHYYERAESRMPRAYKSAVADSALKRCADNVAVQAKDHAAAGLVFAMLQEDGAQTISPKGAREVERLIDEATYDHAFGMADVPRIATSCREMAQPEPGRASSAGKGVPEKDRTARTPDDAERDARAKAASASYASRPAKSQAR